MNTELERAAQSLLLGEPVIYPTETLYALGANALNPQALLRLVTLKKRDTAKPLPVIIADLAQLRMLSAWDEPGLSHLIQAFWPGPLSILFPALPGLPQEIQDSKGFIAMRWTPHPTAQALARACNAPLVATSANLSGQKPASRPEELDQALVRAVPVVLRLPPLPAGGAPSTLIRMLSPNRLEVLREGAVPAAQLERAGWTIKK